MPATGGDVSRPCHLQDLIVASSWEIWQWLEQVQLKAPIANLGGRALLLEDPDALKCRYVVASDQHSTCYAWAKEHDKLPVSFFWLWETQHFGKLFGLHDQLYLPFRTSAIPQASANFQRNTSHSNSSDGLGLDTGLHVTITGFQGRHRAMVLELLTKMGATVQKDMHLPTITHIVARNVHDQSPKLLQARRAEFVDKIAIVNILWVYDCIRNWCLLPEGPYMDSLPPSADPSLNAPASEAHLPFPQHATIPDSPGDDDWDSQQELPDARMQPSLAALHPNSQAGPSSIPASLPTAKRGLGLPAPSPLCNTGSAPRPGIQTTAGATGLVYATPATGPASGSPMAALQTSGRPSAPAPRSTVIRMPGDFSGGTGGGLKEQVDAARAATGRLVEQLGLSSSPAPSALQTIMAPSVQVSEHWPPAQPLSDTTLQGGASKRRRKLAPSNPLQASSQLQQADEDATITPDWILRGRAPPPSPLHGEVAAPAPEVEHQPVQAARETAGSKPGDLPEANNADGAEDPDPGPPPSRPARTVARAAARKSVSRAAQPAKAGKQAEKPAEVDAGAADQAEAVQQKEGSSRGVARRRKPTRKRKSSPAPMLDKVAAKGAALDGQATAVVNGQLVHAPAGGAAIDGSTTQHAKRGRGRGSKVAKAKAAKVSPAPLPSPRSQASPASSEDHWSEASLPEKQANAGGNAADDNDNDISDPMPGVARTGPRTLVALGGMHTKERAIQGAILRRLAIGYSSNRDWEMGVTHLILPKLSRSARILAGLASGSWLLSWDFLTACGRAHTWLEPEAFELQEDDQDRVAIGAPRHWRLRAQLAGSRAFQGLKVTVPSALGKKGVRPDRSDVTTIIQAGGGTVLPLKRALQQPHLDFAVVADSAAKSDIAVQQLLAAKVPCVGLSYVVEWLSQPWQDLGEHVKFKLKIGGALKHAQDRRGDTPLEQAPEASQDW